MNYPDPNSVYIPASDITICRGCRGLFVRLPTDPSPRCPRCGTPPAAASDPPDDCDEPFIVATGD